MLELGSARMRTKIQKARDKRDMNRLRPYRSLLTDWVEPLSKHIADWILKHRTQRGPKPIALPLIERIGTDTCAMVTLKVVLRMLGMEKRGLLALAFEIGTWLEHEDRAKAWLEQDPDSWNALSSSYKHRGSTSSHIKRSRVVIFGKHIKENIEWTDWSHDQRRRVGLVLLDLICTSTKRFSVVKDRTTPRKGKKAFPYILQADPDLMSWLEDALGAEEIHRPAYMPTLIKPKPWDGPRDGGYWTPYVKAPFLIRFKASHEDQRQRAIDEYDALDMPLVYSALNTVQDTAWQINKPVFEVARKVWTNDLALAGFPNKEPEVVPPRPEIEEADPLSKEVLQEWGKAASETHKRNAQRFSEYITFERTMTTAQRFLDEDEFYFPHMLDFRGRMYPIPSDLQPQGRDLQRGLLTFKNAKPVSDEDSAWLAVHLANEFGRDKLGYNERIAWVYDNQEMFKSIAQDPLADRRWMETGDKHQWQALAALLEWRKYMELGAGFMSDLPVRVDGTCNGIQHLSAMVRDEVGGKATNLVPSDEPQDIYQEVADILTDIVGLSESEFAGKWLEVVNGSFPRELTKRPVMVLPYGGTRTSYIQYNLAWLKENDPDEIVFKDEDRWAASQWLANKMWDAVGNHIKRPREVMNWIKKCSSIVSKTGLPIYWVTPSGFVVRHFYGKRKEKTVETKMDGQTVKLTHWEVTPELDTRSQAQGISPNFVHSMDASALMSCVNLAKSRGVENITTIHDAYGTTAGEMFTLSAAIREAFELTYSRDVLGEFKEYCGDVSGSLDAYPPNLPMGALDISQVNNSEYFFA